MAVRLRKFLLENQDVIVINLILLIKIYIFTIMNLDKFNSAWIVAPSLVILLALSFWMVLLPNLMRVCILLLFDMLITILLVSDTLFIRFFQRVIPIPAIYQLDQLQDISQSISTAFSFKDLIYATDLVLIVPYLAYVYMRLTRNFIRLRVRAYRVGIVLLLTIGILYFQFNNISKVYGKEVLENLYSNNNLLNNMGVINYHLVDAYNNFIVRQEKHLSKEDSLTFRGWFEAHQPKTNELNAIAKGKNLIIVQLESTQSFLIGSSINGQEVTPNLNKLMQSSMYFDNVYYQIAQGNSSDAEFMTLTGLYPQGSGANFIMYAENTYSALPGLLKDEGYNTFAIQGNDKDFWNSNRMYAGLGLEKFYSRSELKEDEVIGLGISDKTMFAQATTILEQSRQPFMSHIVTLSSHHPFVIPDSERTLDIPEDQYSEIFTNYLQAQHYTDQALGEFISQLSQSGILDDSVLVIYGDHFGTGWTDQDIQTFMNKNIQNEYEQTELLKTPLFIRLPNGQNQGVNHRVGGQMDIFPTVANLMGLAETKLFYFGQDLFNSSKSLVAFRYYLPDGSFATEDYFYIANWDGVFEHGIAYDRNTGQAININACKANYEEAKRQLRMSDTILQSNAIEDLTFQSEE